MATANVVRDLGDTLLHLIRAGTVGLVDPTRVIAATPDEFAALQDPAQPTITVFLYRITMHTETRNALRRTLPDGRTTRPLMPLELGYMITPWARGTADEYLIAGRVLQALYDRTEIGPADLQGTAWAPDDSVQLLFDSLPLQDHYQIWDTTTLPYRLSLTYLARVIGIEPLERRAQAPVVEAFFGAHP